jgi:SAM-dependent methyltransferase
MILSTVAYSGGFASLLALYHFDRGILDSPRVLLCLALLLRLTLFPALPDLSDDLYRYVWDGWLSVSGINPFQFVPSDTQLANFQDSELFRSLNSPDYHSIYPPFSQVVFMVGGAVYRAAGWPAAAYALKASFLFLEMAGFAMLVLAARAMGLRPRVAALYGLNPLVLVTLTAGGHSESGLILGLGMMMYGATARKWRLSWLGWILATATKGIPLLLGPLLLRRASAKNGTRRALTDAAPALILGLALLVPFYFPGVLQAVGSSADLYVRLFEFNAGPYLLLKETGLWLTGSDWGKVIGPMLGGVFFLGCGVIWFRWRLKQPQDLASASLAVFGLYLLTATTVHPWYLTWGLVLVPLTPYLRGAWLWGSWAAFLSYFIYVGTPQALPTSVFWAGVGVFVLIEHEGVLRDRLLRIAGQRKARQIETYLAGSSVLDLGAGEGYVALALAGNVLRPLMMDVGPYFRAELPRAVYDGLHIPLPDRSVDSVLISLVLHHARNPDRVLEEALRVARERVVITESTYRWVWERNLLEAADRLANRTRGMATNPVEQGALGFRTVPEWEEALRSRTATLVHSVRLNRIGHRHHMFVLEKR